MKVILFQDQSADYHPMIEVMAGEVLDESNARFVYLSKLADILPFIAEHEIAGIILDCGTGLETDVEAVLTKLENLQIPFVCLSNNPVSSVLKANPALNRGLAMAQKSNFNEVLRAIEQLLQVNQSEQGS